MSALNAPVRRAKLPTADRAPPSYSISALAQEFALTTRAIRFYEDEGLLAPARRGRSGMANMAKKDHDSTQA